MTKDPTIGTRCGDADLSRRAYLKGAVGLAAVGAAALLPGGTRAAESAIPAGTTPSAKPRFAYVGCRTTKERNARGEGIGVYQVDASTGAWAPVQLLKDLVNPSFLAFDPTQRFLYTVHGDQGEVSSFAINDRTGELTLLNTASSGGKNPVHLTTDPSGRFLIVANYATGGVATLAIGADGKLGDIVDLVPLAGTPGPHKVEQASSHPHQVAYDPTRDVLAVPDKGLDAVFTFRLDAEKGKLVPAGAGSVTARSTSGPRHIAFGPSGTHAYVVNELDSTVTTYAYDASAASLKPLQILSTLPATFTGENRAGGIVMAPSGRFLHATNRGHNHVAIFGVDPRTGLLQSAGWEPTRGKMPRFITLDPSARFLYAANETTDTIVGFQVDAATGALTALEPAVQTGSPVCVVFKTA
ncbi:lactonase family protein [Skermanella stibiiresistens]|nr:lactonase family protein [Skermanella stibiiresistens]